MNDDRIFRRSTGIVMRAVGEETLLVPISDSIADLESVFTLNAVAAHVWSALDSPRTLDDLAKSVCATFEVSDDEARHDVEGLMADLIASRLVTSTAGVTDPSDHA